MAVVATLTSDAKIYSLLNALVESAKFKAQVPNGHKWLTLMNSKRIQRVGKFARTLTEGEMNSVMRIIRAQEKFIDTLGVVKMRVETSVESAPIEDEGYLNTLAATGGEEELPF